MPATTADITKRKRPDRPGTPILVRLQPAQLASVDAWAAKQADKPGRPEAIRRLVEKAIGS